MPESHTKSSPQWEIGFVPGFALVFSRLLIEVPKRKEKIETVWDVQVG